MRPGRRSTDLGLRRTRPGASPASRSSKSDRARACGDPGRDGAAHLARVDRPAGTGAACPGAGERARPCPDRGHPARLPLQRLQERHGATCARKGDWSRGWILHVDPESSGHPHPDEPPVAWDPPVAAPISIDGNGPVDDYVSFVPTGEARRLTGALQMGTFTLCRPGLPALQVVLAATGRVRVARTSATCPDAPRATACRRRLPSVRSVLPLVGLRLPVAAALPRVQGVDKGSRPCPPRTARTAPPPASR